MIEVKDEGDVVIATELGTSDSEGEFQDSVEPPLGGWPDGEELTVTIYDDGVADHSVVIQVEDGQQNEDP